MSKDKKSDEYFILNNQIDMLKKQNLQFSLTIKSLNSQLIKNQQLSFNLKQCYQSQHEFLQKRVQQLQLSQKAHKQRINILRNQKSQVQISNNLLKVKYDRISKQYEQYRILKQKQTQDYEKNIFTQTNKSQTIKNQYMTAINQRIQYLHNNQLLRQQIHFQEEINIKIVADKQREKIKAVDQVKKQLTKKAIQMKANILIIKKQQLSTKARLTMMQNHQLIQELDYQSKHTQKVLQINSDLQKKIKQLTMNLQVQKEVQHQLAKRMMISKKLLKNLHNKASKLQQSIQQKQQQQKQLRKSIQKQKQTSAIKQVSFTRPLSQLASLQQQFQAQRLHLLRKITLQKSQKQKYLHQVVKLEDKLNQLDNGQNNIRKVLLKFLQINPNQQQDESKCDEFQKMQSLKLRNVNHWTKQDLNFAVKMLLNFVRPLFNPIDIHNQLNRQENCCVQLKGSISNVNLPKIRKQRIRTLIKGQKIKSLSVSQLKHGIKMDSKAYNSGVSSPKKVVQLSLQKIPGSGNSQKSQIHLSKILKSQSQHQMHEKTIKNEMKSSIKQKLIGQKSNFRQKINQSKQNVYKVQDLVSYKKLKNTTKLLKTGIRQWGKKVFIQPINMI